MAGDDQDLEADDQAPTIVGVGARPASFTIPSGAGASSAEHSRSWHPSSRPPSSISGVQPGTSAATVASLTTGAAVREEQAARGSAIVRVGALVSLVAVLALQLPVQQHQLGRWIASGALGTIFVASLALLIAERRGQTMDPRLVFYLGLVITPALVVVTWHVGAMSPASIGFIFGIYYFGMSDAKYEGWVCYLMSSLGYGGLLALTLVGAVDPTVSLFALGRVDPVSFLAMGAVVEMMLGATFWLARLSRAATVQAMVKLERAQRQIQERDALLDEAAQDLQQVLGGRRGRFSGKRIGRFVCEDVIGRGAMGEVYGARGQDDEPVALKVLHPYMLESKIHVERFFREAEISSSLESPHVVRVFDHGVAEDGSPFLAMELLVGHDLAWHLRQRRRFPLKDAVKLVAQLSQALSAAQDAGIVHRDLKPKNVFFDERVSPGSWKILDFGVSKARASSGTLTHGNIIGTPGYMAPEQATASGVDHRADVFSLGAIAYRVLTGRPPFSAPDLLSTMYQVAQRQPVRPSAHVRLPLDIDRALALALAKDRERRLRSASVLAAALRDAARGELDERFRTDADALIADHPWAEPGAAQ